MMPGSIVQFVCFETSLPRAAFVARWEPFVASFLARGIELVVLGERDGDGDFGFVSRNLWPEARFHAVFAGALPGTAGGGGVVAVQGGGFHVVEARAAERTANETANVLLLARCRSGSLGAVVPLLGAWASEHDQGLGWTSYVGDPGTRGGRFDAALEIGCSLASAMRVRAALLAGLPTSHVAASSALTLREALTLPRARGVSDTSSDRKRG